MIADILLPIIRRAILDLLLDIGGEENDDVLAILLAELGHRVARIDVAAQLEWLALRNLVIIEQVGPFNVARSTHTGRDVAAGKLRVEGVSRHKTGE